MTSLGIVGTLAVAPVVRLALEGGAVHRPPADRAPHQPGQEVHTRLGAWSAPMRSTGVRDAGVDPLPQLWLDERGPGRFVGRDPVARRLPPLPARGPGGGVHRVEQLIPPALPTHDLVAEVARVRQDRPHRGAAPHPGRPRMPRRADLTRAGWALAFEDVGNRAVAGPGVEHLEDPPHNRGHAGVGLEDSQHDPSGGLVALRVGLVGVDEPVPVVGTAAEPPAPWASTALRVLICRRRRSAFESPPKRPMSISWPSLSGSIRPPSSGTHSSIP